MSGKSSVQFKRILIAVDGSENANRAAQVATDLEERYGSELIVLHAVARPSYSNIPVFTSTPPPPTSYNEFYEYAKKVAQGYINKTVAGARSRGVKVRMGDSWSRTVDSPGHN